MFMRLSLPATWDTVFPIDLKKISNRNQTNEETNTKYRLGSIEWIFGGHHKMSRA